MFDLLTSMNMASATIEAAQEKPMASVSAPAEIGPIKPLQVEDTRVIHTN
jgi:hypothetical protein